MKLRYYLFLRWASELGLSAVHVVGRRLQRDTEHAWLKATEVNLRSCNTRTVARL